MDGRPLEDEFAEERRHMVEAQCRARGVRDRRVLAAMMRVPRHRFVDDPAIAYADGAQPIDAGQTISQPYMVARMTECLRLSGRERVLEIGAGSGYQTAVLAELSAAVYSLERVASLADQARTRLAELGYRNVEIGAGDGSLGWPDHAPYDRILVTAGAPRLCPAWGEQLAERGILVAPIGDHDLQMLTATAKVRGRLRQSDICSCVFVPLIGAQGWQEGRP
jgi:protein-L-isoaspartate(D-aspartate) O-methyltransferase